MGLDRRCKGFLSLETLCCPEMYIEAEPPFFVIRRHPVRPRPSFGGTGINVTKTRMFTNLFRELRVFVFVRIALLAARKQSRQDVDVQEGFRRQGFLFYLDPADGHRI